GDRPLLSLSFTHQPQRRRRAIIVPPGREGDRLRAMKTEDRTRILASIAAGRSWMADLVAGRSEGIEAIALAEQRSERSVRMTLLLALLSPRIVQAIVEARLPRGIGLRHLCELPPAWDAQERIVGL
ncbi:recombinase family protein, partial [Methylobacterium sp. J-076]|nr:recombinase family protein [Methylobacterium sp. J-076]